MRLALASLLIVGCDVTFETPASSASSIVGGDASSDDPAVVLLDDALAGSYCTGTLVHSRLVLTAKHCVQRPGAARPQPLDAFTVTALSAGTSQPGATSTLRRVVAVYTTDGAYGPDAIRAASDLSGRDVAVLTLDEALTVTPARVADDEVMTHVGDAVHAVGFGLDARGEGRVRRAVSTVVRGRAGDVLAIAPVTCNGDSGGPLFDEAGRVLGVLSVGIGGCGAGESQYTRAGVARALIEAARCALEPVACVDAGARDASAMEDGPGDAAPVPTTPGCACGVPPSRPARNGGWALMAVMSCVMAGARRRGYRTGLATET